MKKRITILFGAIVVFLCVPKFAEGQWVRTNGPYGGAVKGFVAKGANLFAVTAGSIDGGSIYVSTNDGLFWKPVKAQVPNPGPITVSGPHLLVGSSYKGIFTSSDEGISWIAANNGIDSNADVRGFASTGTRLFAATSKGIFLSTNDGGSWALVHGPFPTDINAFKASGSTLFVGTSASGIFLSPDRGLNWVRADSSAGRVNCFAVLDTTILAAGDGIRVSTDGGNTWRVDTSDFKNSPRSEAIYALAVRDTVIFLSSFSKGIMRSTDNGDTWSPINSGLLNTRYASTLYVHGTRIFAGASTGAFRLGQNDTTWQVIDTGIMDLINTALEAVGADLFSATYSHSVFRSSDKGTTWMRVSTGLASSIQSLVASGTELYAGTTFGSTNCLFHSSNHGDDWTPTSLKSEAVNAIAIYGDDIFIANNGGPQYDGIHRSTDKGLTWSVGKGMSSTDVYAIAKVGESLFAGTSADGVYRSDDNGKSWYQTALEIQMAPRLVTKGEDLFAGTNSGVFLTTDKGDTWTPQNSGLTDTIIRTLMVYGSNLFAGTYRGGVVLSTDNGATWNAINTGLTEMAVHSLKVSGDDLYAATPRGVWRRPLAEIIPAAVHEPQALFTLDQNQPNPFIASTSIRFNLTERGEVTLDVYDLLGQKVITLIKGVLNSGEHSAVFDAKDLAAGVYVARLSVNGAKREMKMLRITN